MVKCGRLTLPGLLFCYNGMLMRRTGLDYAKERVPRWRRLLGWMGAHAILLVLAISLPTFLVVLLLVADATRATLIFSCNECGIHRHERRTRLAGVQIWQDVSMRDPDAGSAWVPPTHNHDWFGVSFRREQGSLLLGRRSISHGELVRGKWRPEHERVVRFRLMLLDEAAAGLTREQALALHRKLLGCHTEAEIRSTGITTGRH